MEEFLTLVRKRQGNELESWLERVKAMGIRELRQFAHGLERDKAAVVAGLTLPYSTGPVEGHINRLKPDLSASVWPSRAFLLATPFRGPQPDRGSLRKFAPVNREAREGFSDRFGGAGGLCVKIQSVR